MLYGEYFRHGLSKTSEYRIHKGMMDRCYNKNSISYKYYGGRGIKVSTKWKNFGNFIEDMGLRPSPNHSIDRINNDKGYSVDNCRWATHKEQANNKRVKPMMKKKPTTLFSIQITKDDKQKFEEIAMYRGQTKAGVLRQWIRNSHKQTIGEKA